MDISSLNEIGDAIHVRDLNLSADIAILNDPDEMIARISQPAAARAEDHIGLTGIVAAIIAKGRPDDHIIEAIAIHISSGGDAIARPVVRRIALDDEPLH